MSVNTSNAKLSIPTGLQILLRDLDFLGQIARGQKACITNRVIVDGSTWSGAFYRAWKGENRINTITKIEQIVNRTVDAIYSHKQTDYLGIIINAFSYARNGIDALSSTYQDDPDMKARINVQLQNIDLQLNQYRHLIRGYGNNNNNNNNNNDEHATIANKIPNKTPEPVPTGQERDDQTNDRTNDRANDRERRRRRHRVKQQPEETNE